MARAKKEAAAAAKPKKARKARSQPTSDGAPRPNGAPDPTIAEEKQRTVFMNHLRKWRPVKKQIDELVETLKGLQKEARKDGVTTADLQFAYSLREEAKSLREEAKVSRRIAIARWVGKGDKWGQMDLFRNQAPADPIAEAHAVGRDDAVQDRKPDPAARGYGANTDQWDGYMNGYHEVSSERIRAGIKASETPAAVSGQPTPEPESGTRMTRKEFQRHLQERAAQAEGAKVNGAAERPAPKSSTAVLATTQGIGADDDDGPRAA